MKKIPADFVFIEFSIIRAIARWFSGKKKKRPKRERKTRPYDHYS